MEGEKQNYLKSIYLNPSNEASFGGIDSLYHYVKQEGQYDISKGEIIEFLEGLDVYNNRVKRKRPKRYIHLTVPSVNHLIELDVAYYKKGGKKKFILGAIDTFSRKAGAVALSNIKTKTVTNAALKLIKELGGAKYLRMDMGSEFVSRIFQSTMKENNINVYFATRQPQKAHVIERFFRTLKSRLSRAVDASNTKSWDKLLPKVISAYNNKKHRSLNASPNEVAKNDKLAADLWFQWREESIKAAAEVIPYKFGINDPVKIPLRSKNAFAKESALQNSDRVYFVATRRKVDGIPLYKLKNNDNELVPSSFSHQQLQKVTQTVDTNYRIQKVISRKTIDGKLHLKVQWEGYPSSFQTYVPASEVKNNRYINPDFLLKKNQ